jgi:cell fate regulator YaaT (PSP1 superfamily)
MQDEVKALHLCQTKVRQKKLPMEVIDAEYQWYVPLLVCPWEERRKCSFDFQGPQKIDVLFRCGKENRF